MKPIALLPIVFFQFSLITLGQECTDFWKGAFSTDPLVAKGLSGDSTAAYGLLSFRGKPNLKLLLKGSFPPARFMSIETYETRFQHRIDSLLDSDVLPDDGSTNPVISGEPGPLQSHNYTLELVPSHLADGSLNQMKLPDSKKITSIMFRIYAPYKGNAISQKDLPRVYALDAYTNEPAKCPIEHDLPFYLKFPEFLTWYVPHKQTIEFKDKSLNVGTNKAIPYYLYSVNKLHPNEIGLIRFKAPSHNEHAYEENEIKQTRYWSLCFQDFPKNKTLACVPDFIGTPNSEGMVTIVYGGNKEIEDRAKALGFHFVPDTRDSKQVMLGLIYRNILPEPSFETSQMYQGAYRPSGIICESGAFLAGSCQLEN